MSWVEWKCEWQAKLSHLVGGAPPAGVQKCSNYAVASLSSVVTSLDSLRVRLTRMPMSWRPFAVSCLMVLLPPEPWLPCNSFCCFWYAPSLWFMPSSGGIVCGALWPTLPQLPGLKVQFASPSSRHYSHRPSFVRTRHNRAKLETPHGSWFRVRGHTVKYRVLQASVWQACTQQSVGRAGTALVNPLCFKHHC